MNKVYITTKADDKKISIAEWVIRKNCDSGLLTDIRFGILEIVKETEKAILFKGTYGSFWSPKSQVIFEEA